MTGNKRKTKLSAVEAEMTEQICGRTRGAQRRSPRLPGWLLHP